MYSGDGGSSPSASSCCRWQRSTPRVGSRGAIDLSNKDVCETDEQKKAKEGLLRTGRCRPGAPIMAMGRKYHRAKREEAMTDKQYTAADTLRSAIEALERELSACTLEAHRAIGHRLRAILAAHPEESLRWQCPKCGSSKAEQIPPFHYCQVTGHHEQMSRISRESAPAKEEWFAGDPTGGLSNLPPYSRRHHLTGRHPRRF